MNLPPVAVLLRDIRAQRNAAANYDRQAAQLRKLGNWCERRGWFEWAKTCREDAKLLERAARAEGLSA